MSNQKRAYIYASAVVVFWSTIGSAFKLSLAHTGVWELLLCSSIVATAVLLAYVALTGRLATLSHFTLRDCRDSAFLGLLNPLLYYALVIHAYDLLAAQQASTLNWIWPIVLVLLSIPVLKHRIGLRSILAVVISFFGVLIIGTRGRPLDWRFESPLGVALALSSAVVWALFWTYNTRDKRDEAARLLLNFAFGSLYIVAAAGVTGRFTRINTGAILGGLYIGLFELGITFLLWLKALRLSETTARVANLVYLVPFLGLIVIRITVGETIAPATILGLALIITGILLQRR